MRFNRHSELVGKHAFMSASSGAWLNYDDDKMQHVFLAHSAARRGTDLHNLAAELIRLNVKLPDNGTTMSLYVNDCIGFRMTPEQPLYYSPFAFGTTDAIGYRDRILRIFDLKTGVLAVTKPRQLEIYAAYFCLEYGLNPLMDMDEIDLRIYQSDDIKPFIADPTDIDRIMRKIVHLDKIIQDTAKELA